MTTLTVANDTAVRANQSGWGSSTDGQAWLGVAGTSVLSIVSNKLQVTTPTGSRVVLLGTGTVNAADFSARFTPSAANDYHGFCFGYKDSSNYCYTEVVNGAIRIYKLVAGVLTQLTPSAAFTIVAGSSYWQHLNIVGNVASLRVWADGGSEPGTWNIAVTDTIFLTAGSFGIRTYLSTTGDTVKIDTYLVTNTATTYYVAKGGDDSGPGSMSQPWATLGKLVSMMTAGSTGYVAPGSYPQGTGIQLNLAASGTPGAPVAYIGTPVAYIGVKCMALITTTGTASVVQNTGDYVSFTAFEITSFDQATRLGYLSLGSHGSASFCKIHDIAAIGSGSAGGGGIDFGNVNALYNDAFCNWIGYIGYQSGTNSVHGIYYACGYGNCYNNVCYKNGGWGLHMWHGATNISLMNNLSFGNIYGGIVVGAVVGEGAGLNDYTVVANNILIYNGVAGENATGILETGSTGTHNVYQNNLVWNNVFTVAAIVLQNSLVATGTINADPLMRNFQVDGSGDYHLRAGSPCIAAGIVSGAPTTDFDGVSRGASIDIGPYEYVA